MKQIDANISLEHDDFVLVISEEPEMEDKIKVPLYGDCIVSGLNYNYKDTEETWLMLTLPDQTTYQCRYIKG